MKTLYTGKYSINKVFEDVSEKKMLEFVLVLLQNFSFVALSTHVAKKLFSLTGCCERNFPREQYLFRCISVIVHRAIKLVNIILFSFNIEPRDERQSAILLSSVKN